mmetsp:Transcript_17026/g.59643  ORF Transcript_17026/g.59643 Transcript_17026/m.59643 type:complete len:262 (+) Transcript_17026:707-1492(+)
MTFVARVIVLAEMVLMSGLSTPAQTAFIMSIVVRRLLASAARFMICSRRSSRCVIAARSSFPVEGGANLTPSARAGGAVASGAADTAGPPAPPVAGAAPPAASPAIGESVRPSDAARSSASFSRRARRFAWASASCLRSIPIRLISFTSFLSSLMLSSLALICLRKESNISLTLAANASFTLASASLLMSSSASPFMMALNSSARWCWRSARVMSVVAACGFVLSLLRALLAIVACLAAARVCRMSRMWSKRAGSAKRRTV